MPGRCSLPLGRDLSAQPDGEHQLDGWQPSHSARIHGAASEESTLLEDRASGIRCGRQHRLQHDHGGEERRRVPGAGAPMRPRLAEAIEIVRRSGASPREVNQDITVNEVGQRGPLCGSEARLSQAVDVRHAVGDVVTVGPHAEDRQVAYRLSRLWRGLFGDVHLDPGAFRELHFFQWLEDPVLVFGGDGRNVRPRNPRILRMDAERWHS